MTKQELLAQLEHVPADANIIISTDGLAVQAPYGVARASAPPASTVFLNGFSLEELLREQLDVAYYSQSNVAVLYVSQSSAGNPM